MLVHISEVIEQNQKADIVKEVRTDLLEWFGLPAVRNPVLKNQER